MYNAVVRHQQQVEESLRGVAGGEKPPIAGSNPASTVPWKKTRTAILNMSDTLADGSALAFGARASGVKGPACFNRRLVERHIQQR